MRSRIMDLCALGLLVPLLPACGSDGAPGANGSDGASALVSVVDEPAGANCESAGKKIEYGADKSGDGKLDPDEIEGTQYLCNGADGAARRPLPTPRRERLSRLESPMRQPMTCSFGF